MSSIDFLSSRLLSDSGGNGLVTLMYHSITPGNHKPSWQWALSFKSFCEQLSLLQDHGWTAICAEQLQTDINTLPPKSVLITFDDGYADNFLAFEELAKRNIKATWFVVTKNLGQMSSWVDENSPSNQLLTPVQLREMQDAGMEIGSHTHTHCRLTQASTQQIYEELNYSKAYLSKLLNKPVTSFAYPYGLYNSSVLSATQSAGYQVAFTTRSGFGLVNDNLLEVRRVSIMAGDSLSTFARKLAFADNDVSWSKLSAYVLDRVQDRLKLS
jgi:peptidoglycan/xylan/chitin deacetylase (PgdA/CDA1 family)